MPGFFVAASGRFGAAQTARKEDMFAIALPN